MHDGEHFVRYVIVESVGYIPESNIMSSKPQLKIKTDLHIAKINKSPLKCL